jgi:hypothetical protein
VGAAPERTCVGCRGKASKASLLRLVRDPAGGVAVDPEGVAPGRGAYLHRELGCLDEALRRGGLARALRAGVSADEVGRLRELMTRMTRDS